jgi:hypothetical protein
MKHFSSCIWHRELGIGWEPIGKCVSWGRGGVGLSRVKHSQKYISVHSLAPSVGLVGTGYFGPVCLAPLGQLQLQL